MSGLSLRLAVMVTLSAMASVAASVGVADARTPGPTVAGGPTAVWTAQFGTPSLDEAEGIATDGSGDVYVAGGASDTFPGGTSASGTDAFVRKYDPQGTVVWTREFGTPRDESAKAVAVDASGDVYVAGDTFGAFPGATNADAADDSPRINVFVRKYDASFPG